MNQIPKIAFFDFDGTLISRDSFFTLFKSALKDQLWRKVLVLLFFPVLVVTYLLKLDRSLSKSLMLWSVTVGRGKRGAVRFLTQTVSKHADLLWFDEATSILRDLKKSGVIIVVISASGTVWIRSLLRKKTKEVDFVIGSKLKFFLGGVVLASKNCLSEEKVNRIRSKFGEDFYWHSSWSDHIADLPILKRADKAYVVSPRKKHLPIFKKELGTNVPIFYWKSKID